MQHETKHRNCKTYRTTNIFTANYWKYDMKCSKCRDIANKLDEEGSVVYATN